MTRNRSPNQIEQNATARLDADPPRIRWVRDGLTLRGVVDYDPGEDIQGVGNNANSHPTRTRQDTGKQHDRYARDVAGNVGP